MDLVEEEQRKQLLLSRQEEKEAQAGEAEKKRSHVSRPVCIESTNTRLNEFASNQSDQFYMSNYQPSPSPSQDSTVMTAAEAEIADNNYRVGTIWSMLWDAKNDEFEFDLMAAENDGEEDDFDVIDDRGLRPLQIASCHERIDSQLVGKSRRANHTYSGFEDDDEELLLMGESAVVNNGISDAEKKRRALNSHSAQQYQFQKQQHHRSHRSHRLIHTRSQFPYTCPALPTIDEVCEDDQNRDFGKRPSENKYKAEEEGEERNSITDEIEVTSENADYGEASSTITPLNTLSSDVDNMSDLENDTEDVDDDSVDDFVINYTSSQSYEEPKNKMELTTQNKQERGDPLVADVEFMSNTLPKTIKINSSEDNIEESFASKKRTSMFNLSHSKSLQFDKNERKIALQPLKEAFISEMKMKSKSLSELKVADSLYKLDIPYWMQFKHQQHQSNDILDSQNSIMEIETKKPAQFHSKSNIFRDYIRKPPSRNIKPYISNFELPSRLFLKYSNRI